jgi:hypothetical protein
MSETPDQAFERRLREGYERQQRLRSENERLHERNRVLETAWLDFVSRRVARYASPAAFYQAMAEVEKRHDRWI